jgi:hypothetical protein
LVDPVELKLTINENTCGIRSDSNNFKMVMESSKKALDTFVAIEKEKLSKAQSKYRPSFIQQNVTDETSKAKVEK